MKLSKLESEIYIQANACNCSIITIINAKMELAFEKKQHAKYYKLMDLYNNLILNN